MKRLKTLFVITSIGLLGMLSSYGAQVYISALEATGINNTGQQLADSLDDYWKSGFNSLLNSTTAQFETHLFTGSTGPIGTGYLNFSINTFGVSVSIRNYTGGVRGILQGSTTNYPELNNGSSLQGPSPKPSSLLMSTDYRNENIGSTQSRNAILFEFSEPLYGFGVWLGDVETRTDGNGFPAKIELFDAGGTLLTGSDIAPMSGTNQSSCGGSIAACGNNTTRFVGFSDTTKAVQSMLIIVGDDDFTGNGNTEHLNFVGPTLLNPFQNLALEGRVSTGYVKAGDIVDYTLELAATTIANITNFQIINQLPLGLYYLSSTYLGFTNAVFGISGTDLIWDVSLNGFSTGSITIHALVSGSVASGQTLTNGAQVVYSGAQTNLLDDHSEVSVLVYDTTGTTTTGTTTTGTTTTGTTTTGTTTTGTTTTGTTTTGTTTTGTTTTGTTTTGTTTTGTTTTGTTTTGTTTTGTTTTGTTTTGTTTTGTTTTGTTTTGTTTTGTTTTGTTTTGTTTTGTTTTGTTTTGTTTTGTTTTGTTTTGTTTTGTTTTGTTTTGTTTTGTTTTGTTTTGTTTTGTTTTGTTTTGTTTTGTTTTGTTTTGTTTTGTTTTGTTTTGTTTTGTTTTGTTTTGTTTTGTTTTGTTTTGTTTTGTTTTGTTTTGTTTTGTTTTGTTTTGTTTTGTTTTGTTTGTTGAVRHIPSGVTYDPVPLPTPNVSFLPRAAESAVVNKYKYMLNNKATQRKRNNKRNLPNIDVTLPGWFTIEHSKLLSSAY